MTTPTRRRPADPLRRLALSAVCCALWLARPAAAQDGPSPDTAQSVASDRFRPDYGWTFDPLYRLTTGWDAAWTRTVRAADPRLLAVRPVAGVGIDPTPDRHDNFSSATAALLPHAGALGGQRIVLTTFVGRYHWRSPATPADPPKDRGDGSTAFTKFSDDGGLTWSEGVKLDALPQFPPQAGDARPKALIKAIGTAADGTLYLAAGRGLGVLKSADGERWERLDGAMSEAQVGPKSFGLGSNLIDHPRAGLLAFGHRAGGSIDPVLNVLNSTDGGRTWTATAVPTGDPDVRPVEPTAILYDGDRVLVFGRNGPNDRAHRPFQLRLKVNGPGDYAVEGARLTNIYCTQNPDTHDVILNPTNGRFEAAVHNRGGRAPGVNDEGMVTSLWSIDRAALESGSAEWRYDGALNVMQGDYGPAVRGGPFGADPPDLDGHQDGSHPAAGVLIDADGDGAADRQLLFVQMAASTDSFGQIFAIDRTLDSDALRRYLLPRSPEPFDPSAPAVVARAERPVTIDGSALDPAYGPPIPLRNLVAPSAPRRPADNQDADLSATARLAADDGHLYVHLDVLDDRVMTPGGRGVFRGDAVEIYLSANPPGDAPAPPTPNPQDHWDDRSVQLGLAAGPDGKVREQKHGSTDGVRRAVTLTDGGYRLEAAIPWALVGGRPEGDRFGLELQVADRDAGQDRARKLAWHSADDDAWVTPRNLGTARLAGDGDAPAVADGDPARYRFLFSGFTDRWSRLTGATKQLYLDADPAVLRLDPIALPEGRNLVDGNRTFSRPVVATVGSTLIACYMRREFHWRLSGESNKNESSSYSVVTTSADGGRSWSPPRSLSHDLQGGPAADYASVGNGCVFFVLDEGAPGETVVLVTSSGVYGSADRGETWTLYEGALTPDQAPVGCNFSRQGVVHPEHGLVFFGHFAERGPDLEKLGRGELDGDDDAPGTGIDRRMMVFQSKDRGRTWAQWPYDPGTPDTAKFIEPTAILHGGGLFFLSRNMDTGDRHPIQAFSASGWFPLDYVKTTDLGVSTIGGPANAYPDTPDLIFNPVTNRLDLIVCNRFGGGPRNPTDAVKSLLLYSIDPAEFTAGSTDWRFEGTLLEQRNADGAADGMQPCGSTVDLAAGVQHVAVMLGDVHHAAGDYLVTRTLDTPRLAEYLRTHGNAPARPATRPAE